MTGPARNGPPTGIHQAVWQPGRVGLVADMPSSPLHTWLPKIGFSQASIKQCGSPGLVRLVADIIEGPHLLFTLGCQKQAGAGHNEAVVLLQRLHSVVPPRKDDGGGHGMVQLEAGPCMGIQLSHTVQLLLMPEHIRCFSSLHSLPPADARYACTARVLFHANTYCGSVPYSRLRPTIRAFGMELCMSYELIRAVHSHYTGKALN